jgi:predicted  nucleic acid-binding Zn-ribbon protein
MGVAPTRAEFENLSQELQKVKDQQSAMNRELEIQFKRIADLQAEIDLIRAAGRRSDAPLTPKPTPKR